jgi:chromosomal replication initiator protein
MDRESKDALWSEIVGELRLRFGGESAIDRWLDMIECQELDRTQVLIGVSNRFVLEWFEKKYLAALKEILQRRFDGAVAVKLRVDPVRSNRQRSAVNGAGVLPGPSAAPRADGPAAMKPAGDGGTVDAPAGRIYRLENFVIGRSNRPAYDSLRQVIDGWCRAYNPIFIVGSTGVGKTHLLQGLHWEIQQRRPGLRSRYFAGERFLNAFVSSLKDGSIGRFRERVRGVDVFIFDDFQHLVHKRKTQEEFLHTFDALVHSGAQVIIASALHPKQLPGVDGALLSRLLSGLLVPMEPPDVETRKAFLRSKAAAGNLKIGDTVLDWVAERVQGSMRELLGAFNQVSAYLQFRRPPGEVLQRRRVEELIDEVYNRAPQRLHMDHIVERVSSHFRITAAELRSGRRDRSIARARHMAIYLCRRYTQHSLSEIGAYFGRRNISTVRAAQRKIERLLGEAVEPGKGTGAQSRRPSEIDGPQGAAAPAEPERQVHAPAGREEVPEAVADAIAPGPELESLRGDLDAIIRTL